MFKQKYAIDFLFYGSCNVFYISCHYLRDSRCRNVHGLELVLENSPRSNENMLIESDYRNFLFDGYSNVLCLSTFTRQNDF